MRNPDEARPTIRVAYGIAARRRAADRTAMPRPGRWRVAVVLLASGLLGAMAGCASTTTRRGLPPLATVAHVDLARYSGTWFEIASFPQRFQAGCVASRAEYTPRADGPSRS